MPSTLPILVPGRTQPINVPCELPDPFTFTAFLPSRGLREFTAWLTSTDAREAEIGDVTLGMPETDPRHVGGAYDLDEDEQRRADEAAGDILDGLLWRLHMYGDMARPKDGPLSVIALAHDAEYKAWEALRAASVAVHGMGGFYSLYEASPATERTGNGWVSKAANLLEAYVTRCLDEARTAQRIKAEKQEAEWTPPPKHREDVNPPEWAEP